MQTQSVQTPDLMAWLKRYGLLALAGVVLGYAFAHPFYSMYLRWTARETYYSHGFLVPLVTLGLLWMKRQALLRQPVRRWSWGLGLMSIGLLLYLFGEYQQASYPSYLAFLCLLIGGVGYVFGWPVLRLALFPLLYLFFMLPLPGNVVSQLTYTLKYLATNVAVVLVEWMGVVASQRGSEILLISGNEVVALTVGDVCSGLRSLIALLALGALFGYLARLSTPWKVVLFLLSIPIAFLSNVVRIWTLCMVAHFTGGVSQAVHDGTGYMIYGVALVLLLAAEWLLVLLTGRRRQEAA